MKKFKAGTFDCERILLMLLLGTASIAVTQPNSNKVQAATTENPTDLVTPPTDPVVSQATVGSNRSLPVATGISGTVQLDPGKSAISGNQRTTNN